MAPAKRSRPEPAEEPAVDEAAAEEGVGSAGKGKGKAAAAPKASPSVAKRGRKASAEEGPAADADEQSDEGGGGGEKPRKGAVAKKGEGKAVKAKGDDAEGGGEPAAKKPKGGKKEPKEKVAKGGEDEEAAKKPRGAKKEPKEKVVAKGGEDEEPAAKPKGAKKEPKEKVVAKGGEDEEPAAKPKGAKKEPKEKAVAKGDEDEEPAVKKPKAEPKEKVVISKPELQHKPLPAGKKAFKVISWNVTTIRSLLDKNPDLLKKLFDDESPDLLLIQETKMNDGELKKYEGKLQQLIPGYTFVWNNCSRKKGYSGTLAIIKGEGGGVVAGGQQTLATFFKPKEGAAPKPAFTHVGVTMDLPTMRKEDGATAEDANGEGRTITVEYDDFYVIGTYVPNSGQNLERLDFRTQVWDVRLVEYLEQLQKKKPVIWCGDLNVAHLDEDIWNFDAKHIPKSASCTPQERGNFGKCLEKGFVDAFRRIHKGEDGKDVTGWFSYWSVRAGNMPFNRGLRLDYFVTSGSLFDEGAKVKVHDTKILSDFVALDHAAISLTLTM